ncbi:LapA family protein [Natronospira bacteriovora]|uniref:LapA family protein n=1 Tax=Natronospira bacteriovora TaxID=3069753 RepID=A0ABU0W5B5_9GAMM|nr:LapA family protein [Natronospira sp. AB-CW4]MDQ2069186.1 LapA family protein [Natronospira sp. AB-CW4]
MRYVRLALLVIFMLVAIILTWVNTASVELHYLLGSVSLPLPIALWAAVVIGVLSGFLAAFGMVMKMRSENARLRRAIRLAETEVNNLRSLPIKDGR